LNKSLPVVFTTGKIDINDDEMIKKHLGGNDNYDIIQKPFSMNDILSVLSAIAKNSVRSPLQTTNSTVSAGKYHF
jgi:FixJ family two-component response regulator